MKSATLFSSHLLIKKELLQSVGTMPNESLRGDKRECDIVGKVFSHSARVKLLSCFIGSMFYPETQLSRNKTFTVSLITVYSRSTGL